jgi:4-alpha-glucanotransferase
MPLAQRASGVLLHPTSLPGKYGIGDLGPAAHRWVDWLASAGQKLWQVLPLGQTGYGDSPYQSFSAAAGNAYLISPEALLADKLLTEADLAHTPKFPTAHVDFGPLIHWKLKLLERVHHHFVAGAGSDELRAEYQAFCEAQAFWLDDYALFMALKDEHHGAVWNTWEPDLVARVPGALKAARSRLASAVDSQRLRQFLFFRQWAAVRKRAHEHSIRLIGDIPIFVSYDSADIWAQPELFLLDKHGKSTQVAGVPPDYFSPTGQLWGNPLYDWSSMAETGYRWWVARFRAALALVDCVRLDHFRGFEAYWAVPAEATTAEKGKWRKGPGVRFLEVIKKELGGLPVIAEDLGVITPQVDRLRRHFHLPGMKILQFAFGGASDHKYLPHNYERDCVVYTGTHDNDTTRGWYEHGARHEEKDLVRRYVGRDGRDVSWDLIRVAFASVADTALVPLQDVLSLGAEARMNQPGRPMGNWGWRFEEGALTADLAQRLRGVTEPYGR